MARDCGAARVISWGFEWVPQDRSGHSTNFGDPHVPWVTLLVEQDVWPHPMPVGRLSSHREMTKPTHFSDLFLEPEF